MERNHRKLFPGETPTNQTFDCYGFCDPSCPSNCYSNPDYYFSPPPPPEHSTHISTYLIILISLFTVIFIIVGFYVIKIKCYADWCGRRVNGSAPSQTENAEEFLNENQVDHPVWLIATVGLQQSIINSIAVCRYRKGEGLIEGTECSVCLNEFRDGETLRLLPKCNHAFHIPCIDTWLRSHTNCPLCRAGIVSNSSNSNNNNNNVTPEAAMSNLGSVEQENANLGRSQNQESLRENSTNEGGLSLSNNMVINGALEDRASTGESSETLELSDESNSKEGVLNDPTQNHGVLNDEMQIEMGSMSTDPKLGEANSCSTEPGSHQHHLAVDHTGDDTELHKVNLLKQDADYLKAFKTKRRSSIEDCLHISPVTMKRSFSWNGRILSTRGYMNLNSTLPY